MANIFETKCDCTETDMTVSATTVPPDSARLVRDGKLKLLALASPKRSQQTPEVPTMDETLPGFSAMSLIGVIAPGGTPRSLVERIAADVGVAVRSPEMGARMAQLGMEPVGSSAQEYEAIVRTEIAKWTQVVKTAGIKPE